MNSVRRFAAFLGAITILWAAGLWVLHASAAGRTAQTIVAWIVVPVIVWGFGTFWVSRHKQKPPL